MHRQIFFVYLARHRLQNHGSRKRKAGKTA